MRVERVLITFCFLSKYFLIIIFILLPFMISSDHVNDLKGWLDSHPRLGRKAGSANQDDEQNRFV